MKNCKIAIVALVLAIAALAAAGWLGHAIRLTVQKSNAQDAALRTFFDIKTILLDYRLPDGVKAYCLTVLYFEDGKLVRRGGSVFSTREEKPGFRLQGEFLCNNEGRLMLTTNGSSMTQRADKNDPFWLKMNTWNAKQVSYEGYTTFGFVSAGIDQDGNQMLSSTDDFLYELKTKKYVVAPAIKTFKNVEEAREFQKTLINPTP